MPKVDQHIPQHTEEGLLAGPARLFRTLSAKRNYTFNYADYLDTTRPTADRQKLDEQIPKTLEWYNPRELDFISPALDKNLPPKFQSNHLDIEGFGWEAMNEHLKKLSEEELASLRESSRYLSAIMKGSAEWNPEKEIIPNLITLAYLASDKTPDQYKKDLQYFREILRQVKERVGLTDIPSNSPRIEHLDTIAKHVAVVMRAYTDKGTAVDSPEDFVASLREFDFRHSNLSGDIPPMDEAEILLGDRPYSLDLIEEVVTHGIKTENSLFTLNDYLIDIPITPDLQIIEESLPKDFLITDLAKDMTELWMRKYPDLLLDQKGIDGIFTEEGAKNFNISVIKQIAKIIYYGSVPTPKANPTEFKLRDLHQVLKVYSSERLSGSPFHRQLTDEQRKIGLTNVAICLEILSKKLIDNNSRNEAEAIRGAKILALSHLKALE